MAWKQLALWLLTLGLATLFTTTRMTSNKKQPNIIFILTDDQDVHMNSLDYMPSLQKHIISQGTSYTHHYCTVSLCCPSRVSLFTGKAAHNTNVTDLYPPYGKSEEKEVSGKRILTACRWVSEICLGRLECRISAHLDANLRIWDLLHREILELSQYRQLRSPVRCWLDWFRIPTRSIYVRVLQCHLSTESRPTSKLPRRVFNRSLNVQNSGVFRRRRRGKEAILHRCCTDRAAYRGHYKRQMDQERHGIRVDRSDYITAGSGKAACTYVSRCYSTSSTEFQSTRGKSVDASF